MKIARDRYQQIMDSFEKNGKLKILNDTDDSEALDLLQKAVKRSKKEYYAKEAGSKRKASKILLH